jgi:cell division protein FtsZ
VQGIAELITRPGLINVDFADVRTVMAEMGMAMMGTGRGTGEDRAREAAEAAIASPLLEDINLEGAKGILVNVTAGLDLAIGEFDEVGNVVKERAHEDATVVVGTVIDPAMEGEVRVTVVATGLGGVMRQREPELRVASGSSRQGRVRRSAGIGPVNYSELEAPPVVRRRATRRRTWPRRRSGPSARASTTVPTPSCSTSRPSCAARPTERRTMRPANASGGAPLSFPRGRSPGRHDDSYVTLRS